MVDLAVLMRNAPGFMSFRLSALMSFAVDSASGQCRLTKSLRPSSSGRELVYSTEGARGARAGGGERFMTLPRSERTGRLDRTKSGAKGRGKRTQRTVGVASACAACAAAG